MSDEDEIRELVSRAVGPPSAERRDRTASVVARADQLTRRARLGYTVGGIGALVALVVSVALVVRTDEVVEVRTDVQATEALRAAAAATLDADYFTVATTLEWPASHEHCASTFESLEATIQVDLSADAMLITSEGNQLLFQGTEVLVPRALVPPGWGLETAWLRVDRIAEEDFVDALTYYYDGWLFPGPTPPAEGRPLTEDQLQFVGILEDLHAVASAMTTQDDTT
jgi:hypothetical protein